MFLGKKDDECLSECGFLKNENEHFHEEIKKIGQQIESFVGYTKTDGNSITEKTFSK